MAKDPICGMNVNEKTALRLNKDGRFFYFCSEGCLKKYLAAHHADAPDAACCASGRNNSWMTNKIVITAGFLLALAGISYVVPALDPFRRSLFMYLRVIWWAVLLGLVLGGVIEHFVPREYVTHMLADRRKRTVVTAVILGFFMSACSHGILALAIQLYKKGASTSSVVAFLLASPWANFPLTFMLIGFFGLGRAAYIVFAAIVIALVTGLVYQVLERHGRVETNPEYHERDRAFSIMKDIKNRVAGYEFSAKRVRQDVKGVLDGAVALSNMVLWWILLGVGLASLAGAYVPQDFFHQYMGPTFLGMTVTLLLATVIEVCSEGSSPLAFEIFRQTGALGNSFVFLMAGVATDYTEIGLLWHNVGRRTALWLPVITVPQVLLFGLIANRIF